MQNAYDWASAVCDLISFVAVSTPLVLFPPPKYPEVEFTQDANVSNAGGVGTVAMRVFQKIQQGELRGLSLAARLHPDWIAVSCPDYHLSTSGKCCRIVDNVRE
jgi:hypothetical protein